MLSDDELFLEITRRRAEGLDFKRPLGELVFRWKDLSAAVIKRVQGAFMKGSPDDVEEIFQDAAAKFMARGLDQFRGLSEVSPGQAASPRTFFLRIVKHCAIDRYRRQREELDQGPGPDEEELEQPQAQTSRALTLARARDEATEARAEYWAAFQRLQEEHPNEAAAWELYHHQDVEDHSEVARLLSISVVNSYKRVSRAQAWLKLYLLESRQEPPSS